MFTKLFLLLKLIVESINKMNQCYFIAAKQIRTKAIHFELLF